MACTAAGGETLADSDRGEQTSYEAWLRGEGLPVTDATTPQNLQSLELKPWSRCGGRAAFLQHAEQPGAADCYVCEIAPGASLAPRRHLFEEIVLVLEGRGSTSFCDDRDASHSFEWKAGTLFSVPLNTTYRHFNGSGNQRVLFMAVTTAPAIINAFGDLDFIFGNQHDFQRMSSAYDHAGLDALDCPLMEVARHGAGGYLRSRVGTRTLAVSIAQLAPATYGKAQVYGSGIYTVVLAGEGYSLIWPEGGRRMRRDLRRGALIAVQALWWRQHFNPSRAPLRLVTIAPEAALT